MTGRATWHRLAEEDLAKVYLHIGSHRRRPRSAFSTPFNMQSPFFCPSREPAERVRFARRGHMGCVHGS